jgi:hypothetical protein
MLSQVAKFPPLLFESYHPVYPGTHSLGPFTSLKVRFPYAFHYATSWNRVGRLAGTSITLKLTDSTGAIAYSSPDIIQAGASDSCLNGAGASVSASVPGTSTTASAS